MNNVSYRSVTALPVVDTGYKLAYGQEDLQFGRLFLPAGTSVTTPAPLVVFIHGGCWLNAYDLQHSNAFSQALSQEGFAVWSVEYRRSGDSGGGWPGSFEDVSKALNFSSSLAAYGVDTSRISLVGHSAGGHLALLAAAIQTEQKSRTLDNSINAVIGLAAITDIAAYAEGSNSCQQATLQFMGGNALQHPQAYLQANPVKQQLHTSTLLLHGSADSIVEPAQAMATGQPYHIVNGAGHFDWIHPHTEAYKVFLTTLKQLIVSETP
ncbi:alpha/beta fold hydrolase [Arsukibacterium sp.]|uniref:alpha/beta fold hydrolase n=1 Tax=Arsukibacterium sp. TaxID=1977258 RepID=UPI0026144880|nr:alpha/beta fold hydrolase [Arsukibacterium sp.]